MAGSVSLQDEIIVDQNSLVSFNSKNESMRHEMQALEVKISQLEEALESLIKLQQR